MTESRPCASCGYLNAPGATTCPQCGTHVDETVAPVHPGETLRDLDDLSLPDSPLLRAVVRGDSDAVSTMHPRPASPTPPGVPVPSEVAPAVPAPRPPSPPVDQAALLRDLAESLQARKAEPTVRYAGFFVRLTAFLIDAVVLVGFAVPLSAAGYFGVRAGSLVLGHPVPVEADEALFTILTAAWFAMATIYFTILHQHDGQTIGKSLLGLSVRGLDLAPVGAFRSLMRTLGYAASSTFFGFGFLLIALTPRKRGWHDVLAGTCVVRLAREASS